MFKKGDFLSFNDNGTELFKHISGKVALIVSEPVLIYEYEYNDSGDKKEYYVYDIIVCGKLFMDIPEEFIKRITVDYEKNIK